MLKATSTTIDQINVTPYVDSKDAVYTNLDVKTTIINKAPLVIKIEDIVSTSNPLVFKLNSDVAISQGLNNLTIDYSDSAIIFDDKPGVITFSGPNINVDKADTETLGNTNTDEIV